MAQQFVKGRTDNHLTWVMVDATDFATPESALSAATKIKIYGKLRADDTVRLVSSGTGSLTNDIKHVGASVLGIYTIGLVKADLSDASAAWYDQYIISLSATGAAYQTIIVDGGIDASAMSKLQSTLSDMQSYLAVMSGIQSDIYSLLLAPGASFTSDIASAVWAHAVGTRVDSRLLVTESAASDAASAAQQANSRILLVQSRLSDFDSRLVSDVSDLYSQLLLATSAASDAASAAIQANSRVLLVQSRLSDFDSRLVSDISDIRSALLQMSGVLSDVHSGVVLLQSAFIGHTGSTASQVTDASVLEIDGIDHDDQFNGYYIKLLGGSQVDELRLIVDTDKTNSTIVVKPAFLSRVASGIDFVIAAGDPMGSRLMLTQSMASDAHSAAAQANSRILLVQSRLSDFDSRLVSDISDVYSQLLLATSAASDAASAAQQANSRVLLVQSRLSDFDSRLGSDVSDLYSLLSDLNSQFLSRVPKETAARSQLSFVHSDLSSQIQNITVNLTASDISDIASAVAAATGAATASQVWAAKYTANSLASSFGSLFSDVYSRVVLVQSRLSDFDSRLASEVSDLYSLLSDHHSDFQSRVPKLVATSSQLSDLSSDVKSAVLLTQSLASDAASAAAQANSRTLVIQSFASDILSQVSDLQSDFQSRVPKRVATDSQVSNVHSDLRSMISGITVSFGASEISDIASAVRATLDSDLSDILSAARQTNSRALVAQSGLSDIYSLLSNVSSDLGVMSGVVSDVYSTLQAGVELGASSLSDVRSAIVANGVLRPGVEPTVVPADTATLADKIDWLNTLGTHKIEQTSVLQRVKDAGDTTTIASAVVSDDGVTFIRNEFLS